MSNEQQLIGKPRILSDYIQEQIYTGHFVPGMAIPPIRHFAEQFEMSQNMVYRTLGSLTKRGLLESHHGKGTFVKQQRNKATANGIVAVILNQDHLETSIYGNVFLGIQQAALAQGRQLRVDSIPNSVTPSALNELNTLIRGTRGLIILSEQEERLRNHLLPVPVAGVCMNENYDDTVSVLDIDPTSTARLATDYFRERRFRMVYVFSATIPSYQMRGEEFEKQWRAKGGTCKTISATLAEPVAGVKIPSDSALLFTSGHMKEVFLRTYRKQTGMQLETSCTILELDGKTRLNPDFIQTPSIAPDWKQVGRMALEEVLHRADLPGMPPRRIFVPGRLHEEIPDK